MDREIGRLDKNVRPNASHQFLPGDNLTGALQQNNEDFQSTASKGHRPVAFQQKKARRQQAKRPECNLGWRDVGRFSSLLDV
jgi:hypothetical protein